MEIKGGLKQQRSEKFYLQRRERKGHMESCRGTPKPILPQSSWTAGFIFFYGQCMFQQVDFGMNRCFLGRRGAFLPG
jgi:hypothetical protein